MSSFDPNAGPQSGREFTPAGRKVNMPARMSSGIAAKRASYRASLLTKRTLPARPPCAFCHQMLGEEVVFDHTAVQGEADNCNRAGEW
jgi:hypothetical protein